MRHARSASFVIGIAAALAVGIAVTEMVSRWIFLSFFVGIPAVTAGVPVTAVAMRS